MRKEASHDQPSGPSCLPQCRQATPRERGQKQLTLPLAKQGGSGRRHLFLLCCHPTKKLPLGWLAGTQASSWPDPALCPVHPLCKEGCTAAPCLAQSTIVKCQLLTLLCHHPLKFESGRIGAEKRTYGFAQRSVHFGISTRCGTQSSLVGFKKLLDQFMEMMIRN